MRRVAWALLLILVFTYVGVFAEPGRAVRTRGANSGSSVAAGGGSGSAAGRARAAVGADSVAVLAFYLWMCASYFWTIAPDVTLEKLRGFFQEMMIVWMVWEFAESPEDVRGVMRAYVAERGCWRC